MGDVPALRLVVDRADAVADEAGEIARVLAAIRTAADALDADDPIGARVRSALIDLAATGGAIDIREALGLKRHGGVPAKRRLELAARDRVLRRLRREHHAELSASAAARVISSSWRRASDRLDRNAPSPTPGSEADLLRRLCAANEPPLSARQILAVIASCGA